MASAVLVATSISCKKKKEVDIKDETLVEVYCSGEDYFTSKKFFRSNAIGESLDQMTAKKKAMSNARAQLATDMESTMKIVGDNYVKSSEFNNKEEVTETFQENARTVVDQTLQGIRVICEKQTKTKEGKYKTYIALELSADEVLAKYNERLSKEELLKADYNYEKFKETFDAEMEKLEKQRGY
jgi:predicted metal-binding transcription factor (methanogenesis marker protein 9)